MGDRGDVLVEAGFVVVPFVPPDAGFEESESTNAGLAVHGSGAAPDGSGAAVAPCPGPPRGRWLRFSAMALKAFSWMKSCSVMFDGRDRRPRFTGMKPSLGSVTQKNGCGSSSRALTER